MEAPSYAHEFEIGDWVILTDTYITQYDHKANKYVKDFNYPQEIIDIHEDFFLDSLVYAFSSKKISKINKGQFRKATEQEIKKFKLKNIF
jgi:hypothetical protein